MVAHSRSGFRCARNGHRDCRGSIRNVQGPRQTRGARRTRGCDSSGLDKRQKVGRDMVNCRDRMVQRGRLASRVFSTRLAATVSSRQFTLQWRQLWASGILSAINDFRARQPSA